MIEQEHLAALAQSPANGRETEDWSEICTRPDSNDLMWFCRGDTYDGPREPQYDDADYWDYWCYARPPSLPSADKTAVNEARWKDVEPLDECSLPEFEDHEFRLVAPNTPESAGTKSEFPVCCYCDHVLSCAQCGREQPPIPSPAFPGAGVREMIARIICPAIDGDYSDDPKLTALIEEVYEVALKQADAILSALSDSSGEEKL